MENYYYVGEVTDKEDYKILGFNLTEKEKNKLFYNTPTPSGGMSSQGKYYGSVPFKVEDIDELKRIFELRKFTYHNDTGFSYVILSIDNRWLASGFNEDLKTVLDTISNCKQIEANNSFYVYEITGKRLEID